MGSFGLNFELMGGPSQVLLNFRAVMEEEVVECVEKGAEGRDRLYVVRSKTPSERPCSGVLIRKVGCHVHA